jgi:Bifunctional DNA primase/polymerase, N-terminal
MREGIFADAAPTYREKGFEPRPIVPGKKGCPVKQWQNPDGQWPEGTFDSWLKKYPNHGIGLRMGTTLPGGDSLGMLDIDRAEYVRPIIAAIGGAPCQRVGAKGTAIPVRVFGTPKNFSFKPKLEDKRGPASVECLLESKLCVIPPTIHPDTNRPYKWVGTPLLELDLDDLPIIDMEA